MKKIVLALSAVILASCASQKTLVKQEAKPAAITGFRWDGTGINASAAPVIEWSEKKNIIWKTKVGCSYSSPVVSGDLIFTLSEPAMLSCTDKKTGKLLWQKTTLPADLPKTDQSKAQEYPTSCGFASATPVSDGSCVYIVLANGIVTCFDNSGNRKWITVFNYEQMNPYGRASSPVIFKGKLLVSVDHLIALDPMTGKVLWETEDAKNDFATPAYIKIGNYDLAVMPNGMLVNIADGKMALKAYGNLNYPSPVVAGDMIYFICGSGSAVKVSLDEKGALKYDLVWVKSFEGEFCTTSLVKDSLIYTMNNSGILFINDEKTGKRVFAGPVSGKVGGLIYGGLVIAGKYIVFCNDSGTTCFMNPGPKFDPVAVNVLEGKAGSTPVFEEDKVYVRAGDYLYCIGNR